MNHLEHPQQPPVLLIHGGPIALSVARTLGSRGIKVFAIDHTSSYARYSRYCTWIPISYAHDPERVWIEYLTGEGLELLRGSVILPCSDQVLDFVIKHRQKLEKNYIVLEANDQVLTSMIDKEKTYTIAQEVGVAAPAIWSARTREDILNVVGKITYPVALKPRASHEFIKHFSRKLFVINDADEMLRIFDQVHRLDLEMVITEIIPGRDDAYCSYYTYLDESGNPLFNFTKRKLRQYPIHFGLGTYHVTDWNPEVAEMGLKFLRGAGYRGIANVEFKRDARDGKLKLIECNARLTLVTEMLTISGINMPLLIYNRLTGQPLPKVDSYRKGVYLLRPLVDILAFWDAHRQGEITLGSWIWSLMHRQHFMYFRWRDPMPSLVRVFPFIRRQITHRLGNPLVLRRMSEVTTLWMWFIFGVDMN